MRTKLRMFLLFLIVLVSPQTFAQEREITGQVVDEAGIPIPGVSLS